MFITIWMTDHVCLGSWDPSHMHFCTVHFLNVAVMTFLHQSQIQSSQGVGVSGCQGIRVSGWGYTVSLTCRNQSACKAALIIFSDGTEEGSKNLKISILFLFLLTFSVWKHMASYQLARNLFSAVLSFRLIAFIYSAYRRSRLQYQDLNCRHYGHDLNLYTISQRLTLFFHLPAGGEGLKGNDWFWPTVLQLGLFENKK